MGGTPLARVLVVEDDQGIQAFLQEALRDEGYEVVAARDGYEAIAAVRQHAPDLILLDLMLPALDGTAFLDVYRQAPGPKVPIVVVTAMRAAGDTLAGQVDAVVNKPFSVDRLLETVRHHLGHG